MNAIDLFDRMADRRAAAPALVTGDAMLPQSLSFAALRERSCRLASLFVHSGLVPGDAVIVLLPVGPTFFAVTAALMRAGLTAVFIDPAAWRGTLAAALAGARVRAVVGTPTACALAWLVPGLRRLPLVFTTGRWPGARSLVAAARLPMLASPIACDRDAVALVSFTSGTTGLPKGVLRTHAVLEATQSMLGATLGLREGEVHLPLLPFVVLANLAAGVTTVLPEGGMSRVARLDASRLAARIRRLGIEVVVASPRVADRLAQHALCTGSLDSLRRVFLGGAPVLPSLFDRWRAAAPAARVTAIYGATEAEPIAALRAEDYGDEMRRASRDGAGVLVGMPVPGVDVRVLPERQGVPIAPQDEAAFRAACLDAGIEGEVVVSGANVAPGYLVGAAEAATSIRTNERRWHRTGDAGYLDARGRLWLTGRCDSGVGVDGRSIRPLRVEAALAEDPAIARAALLAHDGRRLLVIEPAEHTTRLPLDTIAARVAFAAPTEIAVVAHMPMDARHGAKVDYRRLAADVASGRLSIRRRLAERAPAIARPVDPA